MKYKIVAIIIILSLFCALALAEQFEVGECCSIDGPANIRKGPNQKIIDSLHNGKKVRIKEKNGDDWYLIEYSPVKKPNICPKGNNLKMGWTYKGNIKSKGYPLIQLMKEGKVLIAGKTICFWKGDQHRTIKILGETVPIKLIGDEYDYPESFTANPKAPLKINVYGLNGTIQKNEIVSIKLDWEGGGQKYIGKIETKIDLPADTCIFVNGYIDESIKNKNKTMRNCDLCTKNAPPKIIECNIETGNFNNDGISETIVHEVCNSAPFLSDWYLCQNGQLCKYRRTCRIGHYSIP